MASSPWPSVGWGALALGIAGAVPGWMGYQEARRAVDPIFGHALDVVPLVVGIAGGLGIGGTLGALVFAFVRGGPRAGGLLLGTVILATAGVWALGRVLEANGDDTAPLGLATLGLLAAPAVFGILAGRLVRKAEAP